MSFIIKSDVQVGKHELNNKEQRGKKIPSGNRSSKLFPGKN